MARRLDPTRVLELPEVHAVLDDLHRRKRRSDNSHQNLALFRLACCCGLRRKEIVGLDVGDLFLDGPKPCVRVRAAVTKGQEGKRKGRTVPLWWDAETLADLAEWRNGRLVDGATQTDPLLTTLARNWPNERLTVQVASRRWRTAIRVLGPERRRQVSIHCGRHTFATLSLTAGRSLVEVCDAMGHANIATTHEYLHLICRDGVPDVFGRRGMIAAAEAAGGSDG